MEAYGRRRGGDGNASKKKFYSIAGDRGLFVHQGEGNAGAWRYHVAGLKVGI
jgi:hypothetical protein